MFITVKAYACLCNYLIYAYVSSVRAGPHLFLFVYYLQGLARHVAHSMGQIKIFLNEWMNECRNEWVSTSLQALFEVLRVQKWTKYKTILVFFPFWKLSSPPLCKEYKIQNIIRVQINDTTWCLNLWFLL